MSVHVAMKLAKSHAHAAEFNVAKQMLSKAPYEKDLSSHQTETILNARLLVCTIGLLQGHWKEALIAADEAQLQLQHSDHVPTDASDNTFYSSVYGLRGF